jgi:uncharacterized membrane protein YedE/YeeE
MRLLRYLVLGILFGVIMTKSEAVSWYRIQEMFRFDSFHMYGIIGTAVVLGALGILLLKNLNVKSVDGNDLKLTPKKMEIPRLLLGGTFFGLGWALTGACPGPLYTLFGYGVYVVVIIIISAILGAFVYGLLKNKLPH